VVCAALQLLRADALPVRRTGSHSSPFPFPAPRSREQDTGGSSQAVLADLLVRMATEHPHHALYQLLALRAGGRAGRAPGPAAPREALVHTVDLDKVAAATAAINAVKAAPHRRAPPSDDARSAARRASVCLAWWMARMCGGLPPARAVCMEGLPWRRRRAPPRAAARPPGDAGICALCLLTLP
jgi:hypothetical protein